MSTRSASVHRALALVLAVLVAATALLLAQVANAPAARAADAVVYDAIPSPLPGNVASLGYAATRTSEFGDLVTLDPGTSRTVDRVEVGFSSWACESGAWQTHDCTTSEGATFLHPVTVTLYEVGAAGAVGAPIATVTQTITAPYRPSADAVNCADGRWWDGTACNNGKLFTASFDFSATSPVVPDQVIVGVAYDTSTAGASPLAAVGPYDALNVAVEGAATTGSDGDPDVVYLNSSVAANYETPGDTGVFRADPGWAADGPYGTLMISIVADAATATEPPATTPSVPTSDADAIAASGQTLPSSVADADVSSAGRTVTLELGPAFANQWFYAVFYSDPTPVGWVWVGPSGTVTLPVPATLPAGTHTIALIDASGNVVAHVSGVSIAALLAATGVEQGILVVEVALGATLLMLGAVGAVAARRRRVASRSSSAA
jgi:hypothetical protein